MKGGGGQRRVGVGGLAGVGEHVPCWGVPHSENLFIRGDWAWEESKSRWEGTLGKCGS